MGGSGRKRILERSREIALSARQSEERVRGGVRERLDPVEVRLPLAAALDGDQTGCLQLLEVAAEGAGTGRQLGRETLLAGIAGRVLAGIVAQQGVQQLRRGGEPGRQQDRV